MIQQILDNCEATAPCLLESSRSSQKGGRGVHPLHPAPRSTPVTYPIEICDDEKLELGDKGN